jgi:hypothetical protein
LAQEIAVGQDRLTLGDHGILRKKSWIGGDPEGAAMNDRMKEALIGGAVLGLVCVVGAYIRSGFTASAVFVFSLWYNRVVMGLVIGAPWKVTGRGMAMLRGAILGLLVSFAFYSSTGFKDHVSFLAGIVYGVILEAWLSRPGK